MKKYLAEFLGTFALALVVALSVSGFFPIPTPILAGLVLGLFVYTIGHISGTHINPAVTLGLWSIGKINHDEALPYIGAQVAGGLLALVLAHLLFPSLSAVWAFGSISVALAEALGAFFFTFGIAAVVYGRVAANMSGVVIGGSLFLGITIAALTGSAGILNPAVAIGLGSFNLMYIIGPIVGAMLGMNAYKYLSE